MDFHIREPTEAYYNSANGLIKLFNILAGVLQGCPLSGSLFVICIDPLLEFFRSHIEKPGLGKVRACADDIGATLNQHKQLRI